jgi:hypothetical protein
VRQIVYLRPRHLGLRTAQAFRLAKQLNDAADGRLVAWLTISGGLAVDPDLLQMAAQKLRKRCDGPGPLGSSGV